MNLFNIIRENCSSTTWSKGVELARRDTVTGDRDQGDELQLRVNNRDRGISSLVYLWPEDEDWSCDCQSGIDPCEHIAAAVIALKRAREQGQALPKSKTAAGRIGYRFRRDDVYLSFDRAIVEDGAEKVLAGALSSITTGRTGGTDVSATQEDMQIEITLGHERRGRLLPKVMERLFGYLRLHEDVRLDGEPIQVDVTPVGLEVFLTDRSQLVQVHLQRDSRVDEVFQNGVARCGSVLHPYRLPELSDADKKLLKDTPTFGARDFGFVAGELLPRLEAAGCRIHRESRHLKEKPTQVDVFLEVQSIVSDDNNLILRPRFVYGDPVIAVVENDRLRPLGSEIPTRDLTAEEDLLREWHRVAGPTREIKSSGASAVRWVHDLNRKGYPVAGDGAKQFQLRGTLRPEFLTYGETLELQFRGAEGIQSDAATVLKAWQRGDSLVPLLNGGFGEISVSWLKDNSALLAEMISLLENKQTPKAAAAHALLRFCDQAAVTPPPTLVAWRQRWEKLPEHKPTLSAQFRGSLRGYQQHGFEWLTQMRALGSGALLADDMGLGKTVQTIAALQSPALIVAPASVVFNWAQELARFRPDLRVSLFHGARRKWDDGADVVLTSYALLRQELQRIEQREWNTVILDEAQNIKNPDSQIARAAFQIPGAFRIALTGTPVENSLQDLWSQFQFLNPGLLGPRQFFQENVQRPILGGDQTVAARLREKIRPFVLRRLKREVARELPPRTETVLKVELSGEERALYDAIYATTQREVVAKLSANGNVMEALTALLRLRQVCCDSALIDARYDQGISSKTHTLVERLQLTRGEGHKSLVFSQWTSYLDRIGSALDLAGIPYLRLDGSTPNRGELVARFQQEAEWPVMLLSLKAGGVGLNLTAADHVFIMDPWWNPAAEDQAADRAHRIGQENPVMIHRIVAEETVEERILELQTTKRGLADSALGSADGGLSLDRNALLALLQQGSMG